MIFINSQEIKMVASAIKKGTDIMKITANIMLLALLFIFSNINLYSQFSGGDGTPTFPYLLSSVSDFNEFRDSVAFQPMQGNDN